MVRGAFPKASSIRAYFVGPSLRSLKGWKIYCWRINVDNSYKYVHRSILFFTHIYPRYLSPFATLSIHASVFCSCSGEGVSDAEVVQVFAGLIISQSTISQSILSIVNIVQSMHYVAINLSREFKSLQN